MLPPEAVDRSRALLGLGGPAGRAAAQNLPSSVAWGPGLGVFVEFGFIFAGLAAATLLATWASLGQWDPAGIIVSIALAIGGLAIGAWGFARRDLRS